MPGLESSSVGFSRALSFMPGGSVPSSFHEPVTDSSVTANDIAVDWPTVTDARLDCDGTSDGTAARRQAREREADTKAPRRISWNEGRRASGANGFMGWVWLKRICSQPAAL